MSISKKLLMLSLPLSIVITFRVDALSQSHKVFNQMSLYSEECYSYADDCSMSTEVYTDTQIRINKAIYGQAAVIFSSSHYNECYSDIKTPMFDSFKRYFTPLAALSFSVAEWGGNGDLSYSFTPAIATKKLVNSGVPISMINPLTINSEYYASVGCSLDDRTYWGPLQINKSYLTAFSNKGYKCGYVPMDYYSWADACQWTFHDKCELVKRSWNKEYEFKNEYEVIAHTSIAHNSGGTHLTSKSFQLNTNWYPWKSSQAVFDYVSLITDDSILNVILKDADRYADNLLQKYETDEESGALYKSINSCRQMLSGSGIEWSLYLKSHWLGNMNSSASLTGDSLKNWEKVMYPVQSIWNYRVLEKLYGLLLLLTGIKEIGVF